MKINKKINYPLLENAFSRKDIELAVRVIKKSKQLTMSKITKNFEKILKLFRLQVCRNG